MVHHQLNPIDMTTAVRCARYQLVVLLKALVDAWLAIVSRSSGLSPKIFFTRDVPGCSSVSPVTRDINHVPLLLQDLWRGSCTSQNHVCKSGGYTRQRWDDSGGSGKSTIFRVSLHNMAAIFHFQVDLRQGYTWCITSPPFQRPLLPVPKRLPVVQPLTQLLEPWRHGMTEKAAPLGSTMVTHCGSPS